MTPDHLHLSLRTLASRRALFHSEADFQHELAWELRLALPDAEVRLERPLDLDERMNVDVVVHHASETVAVELKYWPRASAGVHCGEAFAIRNRGAQDLGRYDYWKDVGRIERLVSAGRATWGAAICLSNDSAYWSTPRVGTMAEPFALHDGARPPGALAWPRTTGTTRGRETPITLGRGHEVHWRTYDSAGPAGLHRYLALVVANPV